MLASCSLPPAIILAFNNVRRKGEGKGKEKNCVGQEMGNKMGRLPIEGNTIEPLGHANRFHLLQDEDEGGQA